MTSLGVPEVVAEVVEKKIRPVSYTTTFSSIVMIYSTKFNETTTREHF